MYPPGETAPLAFPSKEVRRGHLGNRQFRKVCKSCNEGWIKSAEEASWPVLSRLVNGEAPVLSTEDQIRLAVVACLIFCMIDVDDKTGMVLTQPEREEFKRTGLPLETWRVFFGRSNASEWQFRYAHESGVTLPRGITSPAGHAPNMNIATLGLGNLVLHFVSCPHLDTIMVDVREYARVLRLAMIPDTQDLAVTSLAVHRNQTIERVTGFLMDALNPSRPRV